MALGKKEDTQPGGLGIHKVRGRKHIFGKCHKIQCKFCGEMGHIKKLCEGVKKLKGGLKGITDLKNSEEAHDIMDVGDSTVRAAIVEKRRKLKGPHSTVLGAIPVDISVVCMDGSTVVTKEILYISSSVNDH